MKIKSKRHADNKVEPKEDRKIFHVDVGHIAKDDIKRYLEKINEQIKESMGMRMTHANPRMYLDGDTPWKLTAPSVKHIEMPVSYFKELEPIKAEDFQSTSVKTAMDKWLDVYNQWVEGLKSEERLYTNAWATSSDNEFFEVQTKNVSSEKPGIISESQRYTEKLTQVFNETRYDLPVAPMKFHTRYD